MYHMPVTRNACMATHALTMWTGIYILHQGYDQWVATGNVAHTFIVTNSVVLLSDLGRVVFATARGPEVQKPCRTGIGACMLSATLSKV